MDKSLAVDSNVWTYLLEATVEGYDPAADASPMAAQRVAALRILLYKGSTLAILPTVESEIQKIRREDWRVQHDLLQTVVLGPALKVAASVEQRAQFLSAFHNGTNDCRIVAEAEALGLGGVLTFDADFIRNLGPKAGVPLMKPSDYWDSILVVPGSKPVWLPHDSNPLSQAKWWRVCESLT